MSGAVEGPGDDDELDDEIEDELDDELDADDEDEEDGDDEDEKDGDGDGDGDLRAERVVVGGHGVGSFQNADAQTWVAELVESDGADMVVTAIDDVNEGDPGGPVGSAEAAIAIAAAEVVAAARGKPRKDIPEAVRSWTKAKHLAHHYDLGRRARLAVERVLEDSELADAWTETEDADAWRADVEGLLARLVKDPGKAEPPPPPPP